MIVVMVDYRMARYNCPSSWVLPFQWTVRLTIASLNSEGKIWGLGVGCQIGLVAIFT
jgi:hypothetical protein